MRILVSAASKYGSTAEIAEAIARELREAGHDVTLAAPDDVRSVEEYGALVLGSAVYVGHWLEPIRKLIDRERSAILSRPVWLFSSGPIGEPLKPAEEQAVSIADLVTATAAREHRLFAGKIDKRRLSFPERAMVFALRVPEGDFRDWDEIAAWARSIAEALGQPGG